MDNLYFNHKYYFHLSFTFLDIFFFPKEMLAITDLGHIVWKFFLITGEGI